MGFLGRTHDGLLKRFDLEDGISWTMVNGFSLKGPSPKYIEAVI